VSQNAVTNSIKIFGVKMSISHRLKIAVAFLIPYLLWAIFRSTDTWHSAYFSNGAVVTVDCVARLALLLVLFEACRGIGRLTGLRAETFGNDYLAVATGFAVSHIVGGILGYLGWLNPLTAILYFGVGLSAALQSRPALLRASTWRELPLPARLTAPIAICAALFFIAIFAIGRAIPVDVQTNDFAHYLPYYELTKTSGFGFPSTYFVGTYYLKGAGLNHFVVQLSDPVGSQLVGAMAVILIGMGAARLAMMLTWNSPLIGAATGIFVVLCPAAWFVELEKAHALVSAMITAFIVLAVLEAHRGLDRFEHRAAVIVATALPMMLPVAAIFLLPVSVLMPLGHLQNRRDFFRAAQPFAAATLALIATLLFAYLRAGMPEFSPLKLMWTLRNENFMSRWIDPSAIHWLEYYISQAFETHFSLVSLFSNEEFLYYASALVASALTFVFLRKRSNTAAAVTTLVASLGLLALISAIQVCFPGQTPDLARMTAFMPALFFFIPLALVKLLSSPFRTERPPAIVRLLGIGLSLASVTFVFDRIRTPTGTYVQIIDAYRPATEHGLEVLKGLRSRSSQVEQLYPADECDAIAHIITADGQVFVMGFRPGCYVRPGVRFHRFDMNPVNIAFGDALFGTPETSKKAYLDHGIRYFLFSTSYSESPVPQMFSPLLSPENMPANFRVAARVGTEHWLLILGGDGTPLDREFLDWYSAWRLKQAESRSARAYQAIARERGAAP
jgi:hypothetical protein